MSAHLPRQLEKIKKMMLDQGRLVQQALDNAIAIITRNDIAMVQGVIDGDLRIDLLELDIEEECLAALALHQPVAHDLRFVVAVLKGNHDLERIGDLAKEMAVQAGELMRANGVDAAFFDRFGSTEMLVAGKQMLEHSLQALVDLDANLAQQVRRHDDHVDQLHDDSFERIQMQMASHPEQVSHLIRMVAINQHLERLADHAVNIAKDVVYLVEGRIDRHRKAKLALRGEG